MKNQREGTLPINKKNSAHDLDECTALSKNQDGGLPSQPIA